jgi:hypothetical protein
MEKKIAQNEIDAPVVNLDDNAFEVPWDIRPLINEIPEDLKAFVDREIAITTAVTIKGIAEKFRKEADNSRYIRAVMTALYAHKKWDDARAVAWGLIKKAEEEQKKEDKLKNFFSSLV